MVPSQIVASKQDRGAITRQRLRVTSALEMASDANTNSSTAADIDRTHRVEGLLDVSQDLEASKAKDDVSLKKLEKQIVELVRERDAVKHDEAHKSRELAFLHTEIRRARGTAHAGDQQAISVARGTVEDAAQASSASSATASTAGQAAASTATEAEADAAIASAEQVVTQSSASADASSSGTSSAGTSFSNSAATAQQASVQAASSKVKTEAEMEAEAEARMRAEAEARARKKIEEEEAQKQKVAERQRQEEDARQAKLRAQQAEKRKIADSAADSADDSFKQFMKEEDGEDQMGDTDYEDSANALAGAIGWNRKEIESKADSAVKQLTEAIGGKKSIQAVQGMMAGIR